MDKSERHRANRRDQHLFAIGGLLILAFIPSQPHTHGVALLKRVSEVGMFVVQLLETPLSPGRSLSA